MHIMLRMTNYAIDDQHGNLICTGLTEAAARAKAQREANERSAAVLLYVDGSSEPGEVIEPCVAGSTERAEVAALRLRAVNDATRTVARDGLSLSHQEADSLGEEVLAWARQRLGVRVETDSDGVRLVPETPPAMDPDRRAAVEKVAEQWCLTLHGPASVPVVVEILIAEGPHGEARPWSAGRIRELGEIDIFAKRDGGSMFAQLRRLLGAQGFEILAYQSLGSSSHHEHQARVGRLAGR